MLADFWNFGKSLNSFWDNNLLFRRSFIVIFSSVAVFGSMAACTLPGFRGGAGNTTTTLGVLKRDPSVRQDGFGSVKFIKNQADCSLNPCLSALSGLKMLQTDEQTIYFLSRDKGLFRTTDGGRLWERLYFFPINNIQNTKIIQNDKGEKSTVNKTPEEIQSEVDAKIAQNDSFIASDFTVDLREPNRIYVSGLYEGVGKILRSVDSGVSFREIYGEVEKISVKMVAVHPQSSQRVFGILDKGALIRSMDGGVTWQKVRSFKEVPIQMGFVPEFGNLFFALFPTLGLATSKDDGETWQTQELTRQSSQIGETQNRDKFEANPFANKEKFGKYEKVIPVVRGTRYLANQNTDQNQNSTENSTSSDFQIPFLNSQNSAATVERVEQPWLLVADRQVWFAGSPTDDFTKLILPVQAEQYNILDAAPDPRVGLDKILVSVDNKIFETQNRGQSWSIKDKIQRATPIGNIGQILIDKNNSEIIYLMLIDNKAKRSNGFGL